MRSTSDRQSRDAGPRLPKTFIEKEEWLERGFLDSPEFSTLPEHDLLAEIPERDARYDKAARTRTQSVQNYVFHEERLQRSQYSHLFRKMNYLKKRAMETGSDIDREEAWKIRQQLAGEFFWIVEEMVDEIQSRFPEADLERIANFALEELYRKIDEYHYLSGAQFGNFAREQIFKRANQGVKGQSRYTKSIRTGIPLRTWGRLEATEEHEPLDKETILEFWSLVCKKMKSFQSGEMPKPWHGRVSQAPLTDILYTHFVEGKTLEVMGIAMSITRERVRQLITTGLRYVREIVLHDPEVQEFLKKLNLGVEDEEDVNLLINRMRARS